MIEHLLGFYEQATPQELQAVNWYREAHDACLQAAQACQVDFTQFVYAVAALSPHCPWVGNIQGVIDLATRGTTRYGFRINREKALHCLDGNFSYFKGGEG